MTRRLYEEDSFLWDFEAAVTGCTETNGAWLIELDQTAFFPEGGGQGADHGTLGDAQIRDVRLKGERILHTADRPLPVGATVRGRVDGERRLEHMQLHSGEHIFSGLVHSRFGYDNVGFHMGSGFVTMDFSGPMIYEDALAIERAANEAVWKDLPVRAEYPSSETLAATPYRSKKALEGPVRLVVIEGYDVCACCGTHVRTTGQIGLIKVTAFQNYKGGVRVSLLCGARALAWVGRLMEENQAVSHLTSEQPGHLAAAVEKLIAERDALRYAREQTAMRLFESDCARLSGPLRVVRADDLALSQLRPAAGQLARQCDTALVLQKREGGWNFALCSLKTDVRPLAAALREAFGGRGGGSPDMVQGILGEAEPEAMARLLSARA